MLSKAKSASGGKNSLPSHTDNFNKLAEDSEFILNQNPSLDTPIHLIKAEKSKTKEPSHAEPLYMGAGRWFIPELKR